MSRMDLTTSVPVFAPALGSPCGCVPAHARPCACPARARPYAVEGAPRFLMPAAAEARGPSGAASLVGQQFGHFRLLRELGRGSLGTVLLAEHALIQKRVAIQVLHAHVTWDAARVARFLSEARTLTLIQHPNVVSLYDLGLREGRPYLVREYLEGQSLASFAQGPLAPALVVDLLCQVCDALAAAHAHGIAHGSLQPANVFLVPDALGRQHVKLLDFGIARLLPPFEGAATDALDTPASAAGDDTSRALRADLHAVGELGALLATGRASALGGAAEDALPGPARRAPSAPRDMPSALSRVLLKAMARRPAERYASAGALRDALQASLALDGAAVGLGPASLQRRVGWDAPASR
ncbi:serine/threonine-protein kinase [Myxococcus sp. Y35]|uniref:serine/threonine-protein kinase n=1 Tax=Pseudomyxococcus flavus TaxID=3115648 RepID=UPI003CE67BF5